MMTSISALVTTTTLVFLFLGTLFVVILRKPKYIIYLYCIVISFFTTSIIGARETITSIYHRGIGVLPLTLINIYLIGIFVYFFAIRVFHGKRERESFTPWTNLFILALFCMVYLLFGALIGVPVRDLLNTRGVINIINMWLFVSIIVWGVESVEQLSELKNIVLFCLFLSALYGCIRFLFMGGDPANVYANIEEIKVKLTYADIGQSVLFCFSFSYSILILLKIRIDLKERLFFTSLAILSLFNIMFSYRRNAWVGILILLLWLVLVLDLKKKLILIVIAFVCVGFLGTYVVSQRFSGQGRLINRITLTGDFTTKDNEVAFKKGRFAELYYATTATLEKHPFFGFGPWGRYSSSASLGQFAYFTHSAVVHILFKTGIIGLFLFCSTFFSLIYWTIKHRKLYPSESKNLILSDAAFGCILFYIPDVLFGTPIIIFRHLQIVAFFMAIIYCAYIFRKEKIINANT